MAQKDPAFLLYPGDVYKDTATMSNDEKGKYLSLLMLQHRFGSITQEQYHTITGQLYDRFSNLGAVFEIDTDKTLYIHWHRVALQQRKEFCDSRRRNRKGNKND